jgi:hypothetical protein
MTSISHATAERVHARASVRMLTGTGVFVAMLALGLGFSLRLLNPWDESWFVQLIARMRAGAVLYRDISYGAGPLPAYATEAVTYLTGVDVIAVKLVVVLAFAGSALLAWLIAEELGIRFAGRVLLLGAIAYFAPPLQQPPYSPLATTFLLATLLAALRARSGNGGRTVELAAIAGGVAAALAFASKQDVGMYALAALLVVLAVERRLRDCLLALSSFVVIVGTMAAFLWLSGGLARYVDYGFTGKGAYVHARVPFATGVDGVLQSVRDAHSVPSAEAAYWALGFFLPCLAFVAALALLLGSQRKSPHALPVVLFAAAGAATLFPRFDVLHVAYTAPVLVVLLAHSLHLWRARLHPSVFRASALWTGVAVLLMATLPIRLAHSSAADLSTLPHLRGTFIEERDLDGWQREAARLTSATGGTRDVLLLLPDAGFRYLTTALRNPTPFDFPFVTTFGRNGQERVIDSIASGRIAQVCLGRSWFGLEPKQLVTYVRTTMRVRSQLGFCTLYEKRA